MFWVIIFFLITIPLCYIYRYQCIVALADLVLIILHIFGLCPDPRYKTSHALGIYTELDLLQHFEDVINPTQLNIIIEYRRTLEKLGHFNIKTPTDEQLQFSRQFQAQNNLHGLETKIPSTPLSPNGQTPNGSFHSDDFILAKKQQQYTAKAISLAGTGIITTVSYAGYVASSLYGYATQKYTEYQQNNITKANEKIDDGSDKQKLITPPLVVPVRSATQTKGLTRSGGNNTSPTQIVHPESNENTLQQQQQKIDDDEFQLGQTKEIIFNNDHNDNNNNITQPQQLDELHTVIEEQADSSTDTFVDSLQRSFSSLFFKPRKNQPTSDFSSTTKTSNTNRFSITTPQQQQQQQQLNLSSSLDSTQQQQATAPLLTSSDFLNESVANTQLKSSATTSSSLTQSSTNTSYPDLRTRLHRLSNQPQMVTSLNESNSGLAISQPDLTSTSQQQANKRTSYIDKYKKQEEERQLTKIQQENDSKQNISLQIGQNKNVKRLEAQLTLYATSSNSNDEFKLTTTQLYKLLTPLSIYHGLSRTAQYQMFTASKYKATLPQDMVGQPVNIPLLAFRFVDYNTIHLVLFQIGYSYTHSTSQPFVPLPSISGNATKKHPTLQVFTNSTSQQPPLSLNNNKNQSDLVVPFVLLSSTLTTYTIYDLLFILNNFSFDKDFQREFLLQQNKQINHQQIYAHELSTQHPELFPSTSSSTTTTTSPSKTSISTITIPCLYEKIMKTDTTTTASLAVLSQDKTSAGENSALILNFSQLSHIVPGRRRSLYNTPPTNAKTPEAEDELLKNQTAINSLHHSLFFSLVVESDIYDFIALTTHQRDLIVADLQAIVLGTAALQEESTETTTSSTSSTSPQQSKPIQQSKSIQNTVSQEQDGTAKGGYNLRPRK